MKHVWDLLSVTYTSVMDVLLLSVPAVIKTFLWMLALTFMVQDLLLLIIFVMKIQVWEYSVLYIET